MRTPQEAELHDSSDDADYAASQQQGSSSLMQSVSSNGSHSGEPDDAEVVYSKDNIAVHPTQFASDRISGRLKLIKQSSSIFLTWIPYKSQVSNLKLSEEDRNLYTIKAVPLTDMRSIRRHAPNFGWQYIIIVLSSGIAFPPLYFYGGGIKEFLANVKQHVFLVRSAEDSNVFIMNDSQNPLQRSLSSLQLPRALSVVSAQSTDVSAGAVSSSGNQGLRSDRASDGSSSVSQYSGRRQKIHDQTKDIPVQVLEKFSLVTKFARETTSQLFRDNSGLGSVQRKWNQRASSDADRVPHAIPITLESLESKLDYPPKESHDAKEVPHQRPIASDPVEFDKLSLVWGKPRQAPLGLKEWTAFLDAQGRVADPKALKKRIFYGGIKNKLRREVWPFLLEYHGYETTYTERQYLRSTKKLEYETLKQQWQSVTPEQAKRFTKFRERKGLIEKDVVRTDRSLAFYGGDDNPNVDLLRDILLTYSFYNFDLGYCQGMNDLLSPILFIMEDESESFWCFVALMERLAPNFSRDQNGVHSQLFALSKLVELLDSPLHIYFEQNECLNYFFCFRWILIQFKREFEYEKTMVLWEVLWTHYLSEHLHLYVCVAILKRFRGKIMGEEMDFDTLLKFINELSGHIDLDTTLRDAEALCICAGENGPALIPPGTPPSLPVGNVVLYEQDEVL